MKKIIVVRDMQNDFIDGPLGTPEARAIVDKVCEKIRSEEWDYIYYTLDTHDEKYLETHEGKKLPVKHCIKNTSGWMLNSDVMLAIANTGEKYERINKHAFGSWALAHAVDFLMGCFGDVREDETNIELTLVGVCTDICVISNALLLKAYFPEMKIVVDAECCAGSTVAKHWKALDILESCQIDILNDPFELPLMRVDIDKIIDEFNKIPL